MKAVYVVWIRGSQSYDIPSEMLEVFSKEEDAIKFTKEYNKQFQNLVEFYNAEIIEKELK